MTTEKHHNQVTVALNSGSPELAAYNAIKLEARKFAVWMQQQHQAGELRIAYTAAFAIVDMIMRASVYRREDVDGLAERAYGAALAIGAGISGSTYHGQLSDRAALLANRLFSFSQDMARLKMELSSKVCERALAELRAAHESLENVPASGALQQTP